MNHKNTLKRDPFEGVISFGYIGDNEFLIHDFENNLVKVKTAGVEIDFQYTSKIHALRVLY